MKLISILILVAVLSMTTVGLAQQASPRPDDIPIELVQENEFVVKLMDVFDKSGKKIKGPVELDSFRFKEKLFVFKAANGKLQKISDKKIDKIALSRLRQGVLTGKPPSLRVNVWHGKTRNFELQYSAVKIKDGHLYLSRNDFRNHFNDADMLRATSNEWSGNLSDFWKRKEIDSPEVFSSNFAFKNGHGLMSRHMAAAYCRTCLKIEILSLKIDSATETISIRCQEVFYDKYNE